MEEDGKLIIYLPDNFVAKVFEEWLDGQGEQDLFYWAEEHGLDVKITYEDNKIIIEEDNGL
jgi:hypothetical protein